MSDPNREPVNRIQLGFRGVPGVMAIVFGIMAIVFLPLGLLLPVVRVPFVIVGAGFAVLAVAFGSKARRQGADLQALGRTGERFEGIATGWQPTYVRINSVSQYRLKYRFTGPDGITRDALGAYRRPEDVVRVDEGAAVTVLVDPANPEIFALERDLFRET